MSAKTDASESIWSLAFVSLIFINLFQSMGQTMMNTILPLYARDLGASASVIGMVVGAFAITALGIRPFAGPAFDSFSKKKMLLAAYCVVIVATFLYGLADTPLHLFFVRLLHGAGIGCAAPLGMALATETLPEGRMSSGIGFYSLAQAVSMAIGPALGIWLSRTIGYQNTYFIAGISLSAAAIVLLCVKIPDKTVRRPYKISLNRMFAKEAIAPACMLALLATAFSCTGSYIAIYGDLCGVTEIGLYFTTNALCLLVTRPLFGRLSDEHGLKKILLPAVICFAVSYVMLHFTNSLPGFLFVAVLAACGYGVCHPMIQSLAFSRAPRDRRGSASNTSYCGLDIGMLIGPTVGGAVIENLIPVTGSEVAAYSDMWLVMIIPIALAFIVMLVVFSKPNPAEREEGQPKA